MELPQGRVRVSRGYLESLAVLAMAIAVGRWDAFDRIASYLELRSRGSLLRSPDPGEIVDLEGDVGIPLQELLPFADLVRLRGEVEDLPTASCEGRDRLDERQCARVVAVCERFVQDER